jgi:tetratricopeptide (TPR) repeat protein
VTFGGHGAPVPQALPQAIAAWQAGRRDEAERLCRQVLGMQPGNATALQLLGMIAAQAGRPQEAADLLSRAAAVNPGDPAIHNSLGNALRNLGRHAEAVASYDRALALRPDIAGIHLARGQALLELGRPGEALESLDRAVALDGAIVQAWGNRGLALRALGRHEQAAESLQRAAQLAPQSAEARNELGAALLAAGQAARALECFDTAASLRPDFPEALGNRAVALLGLGRAEEALASVERAIALQPGRAEFHGNRGMALMAAGQAALALASFDRALALDPAYADAHANRGLALAELHRFDEAEEGFRRAIAIDPDHASARFSLGVSRLQAGDYEAGWAGFEWRWKEKQLAPLARAFREPRWAGDEDLRGKTLLIHAEQGLGDTLQFCRFVAPVAARGATVVLEVQPALVPLLAGLAGAASVVPAGAPLPPFDRHCPLLSLPFALHAGAGGIGMDAPYIRPDSGRVARWRQRLGEASRPRVGLAWSGNPGHRNDRNRSASLAAVRPLLEAAVEVVSLQKEVRDADRALLASDGRIRHFGEELADFADAAALVEAMDVVVAVDTSVAHLAGAMGKPVWVLLPHGPDWRWQRDREDSPWYPSARLFRQDSPGNWAGVVARVGRELAAFAESGG